MSRENPSTAILTECPSCSAENVLDENIVEFRDSKKMDANKRKLLTTISKELFAIYSGYCIQCGDYLMVAAFKGDK